MKFQVGDKVLIPHSNEEGEVVEIIDRQMVMVDVRGVRFPVYADQLEFPYFKRFTQQNKEARQPAKRHAEDIPREKKSTPRVVDGMWLHFLPVFESDEFGDDVVDRLKVHLVNHTEKAYRFSYAVKTGATISFDLKNDLQPFQEFYLHDIPFEQLNDNPAFHTVFQLVLPEREKAAEWETSIRLKARPVFLKIEEMKQKGNAGFSYKLFDQVPEKAIDIPYPVSDRLSGARIYEAAAARRYLEPARQEVDLHIEKLADDWRSLDNFEMLTIQLREFEKWFDLAVAHHLPSMVVIHGVGSGKLRDEIHEILRLKREVKFFVNQYDARYGYGATEIFFQY